MHPLPPLDDRALAARRALVARHDRLMGVDNARAEAGPQGWQVLVQFIRKTGQRRSVPAGLTPAQIVLRTTSDHRVPAVVAGLQVADDASAVSLLIDDPHHVLAGVHILDFNGAEGIDPLLSRVRIVFGSTAVETPGATTAVEGDGVKPADISYLAKDYASFRRLMLDRLTLLDPGWTERHAADIGVTLVEVLAYAGDYLSYYQDAVATEAYLSTARRLVSVRRHARLLDYPVRDGCNARVWVQIEVDGDDEVAIPKGLRLLPGGDARGSRVACADFDPERLSATDQAGVFETMHAARLWKAHNRIPLYRWGAAATRIPANATTVALDGHFPHLRRGDVLIFEELRDGAAGMQRGHPVRLSADPELSRDALHDHPITLVAWAAADKLPFDLPLGEGSTPGALTVARGNVVLADHGCTLTRVPLRLGLATSPFRPKLPVTGVVRAAPYDDATARARPAADAMRQADHDALPLISLVVSTPGEQPVGARLPTQPDGWQPVRDLVESGRFAREFVLETESDGSEYARFGDGHLGCRPAAGTVFMATVRVSGGGAGQAGPGTITRCVSDDKRLTRVSNPLPASQPVVAETIESIRAFAPVAPRRPLRVVTDKDYVAAALTVPAIAEAAVARRWTGGWPTTVVYVRRGDGAFPDDALLSKVHAAIESRRIVGADFEVRGPDVLPVRVGVRVRAGGAVAASFLRERVERLLSSQAGGVFDPARVGFGQPLYASTILAAVRDLPGDLAAELTDFQRQDGVGSDPTVIVPDRHQVISLGGPARVVLEVAR